MSQMSTYATYPSLRDRVVFVSGGATGLGAEFVTQFVDQGARVGFVDIDEAGGRALVARLAGRGATDPLFLPADVRDIDAYTGSIRAVAEQLGPITVLVNSAASDTRHAIEDVTPAYWDERMAVNLRHHFFAIQTVVDGMRQAGGGSIINLGSISAHAQFVGMPAYITAKAGIEGLTHTLARQLGPDRIRVNCLAPGWVITERQLAETITPEAEDMIAANQCLPDRVVPADIARMLLWLASDDSAAVTGQVVPVNAGWV